MKEKIIEIIDKHIPEFSEYVRVYIESRLTKNKIADEIEELYKDYYPSEFIHWFHKECGSNASLQIDDGPIKYITRVGAIYKTLDELLKFWQTEIKDK